MNAASIPGEAFQMRKDWRCGVRVRRSPSPGLSATVSPDWARELTLVFTADLQRTKDREQKLCRNQPKGFPFPAAGPPFAQPQTFLDRPMPDRSH
jgi:hypothetical protein